MDWVIHDMKSLNKGNNIIKSPNFRIGNSIWYVSEHNSLYYISSLAIFKNKL